MLFAIATHPLFVYLDKLADDQVLFGLSLPSKHLIGQGFANDPLMFLKATNTNVQACLQAINTSSLAAGLELNLQKSSLIDVSSSHFDQICWAGQRFPLGHVFRHLGYPIGVGVTSKQLTSWITLKINKKINYWKSPD